MDHMAVPDCRPVIVTEHRATVKAESHWPNKRRTWSHVSLGVAVSSCGGLNFNFLVIGLT